MCEELGNMGTSEQIKIDAFIDDVNLVAPEQAIVIAKIRRLFNKKDQAVSEQIKYGGLVFLKSGVLIGGVFPYKNHISIEFSNGADFNDPQSLLEGKGKKRRHLKIHDHKDIDKTAFFIEQSLSVS